MKNILRKIYVLAFASTALLVSGCSELVDCVASARPNLHSKNLATGRLNLSYEDYLEADVTNDPHDDEYDYFFSVQGNLPPGMTYREQRRRIYFTGTPSQKGTYAFRVRLTVDRPNWNNDNRICFGDDTTTKEFTIVIN